MPSTLYRDFWSCLLGEGDVKSCCAAQAGRALAGRDAAPEGTPHGAEPAAFQRQLLAELNLIGSQVARRPPDIPC